MRPRGGGVILLFAPAVTLLFTPNLTYEPFVDIKLLVLGVCAGIAFVQIFDHLREFGTSGVEPQLIVGLAFLCSLFIPVFFAESPFSQQLYGIGGRYLGFLHYFFLLCLFISFSLKNVREVRQDFLNLLILTGICESTYSLIQFLNLDPIHWENEYNWVFGTFGNPNFLSTFVALSMSANLFSLFNNTKIKWKLINLSGLFLGIFSLISAGSIQGFVLISISIFLLLLIKTSKNSPKVGLFIFSGGVTASIFFVFGLLKVGPLAKYLYQESTAFRGDYWRAGMSMAKDHILTGVGLDSYGDFYRQYRDISAVERRGLDNFADSAHNIFIDMAANGGLFLLISYCLLIVLVFINIYLSYKKSKQFNTEEISLVVIWFGFQIQTVISINVSSIAVWGWIAGGLIISKNSKIPHGLSSRGKFSRSSKIKRRARFVSKVSGSLVFALLVMPIFLVDIQIAKVLSGNSSSNLRKLSFAWPNNCAFRVKAAEAYFAAGDLKNSLEISQFSIKHNPRCFESYKSIYTNPRASLQLKNEAYQEMLKLDPLFR